jgi:hypothetical protein
MNSFMREASVPQERWNRKKEVDNAPRQPNLVQPRRGCQLRERLAGQARILRGDGGYKEAVYAIGNMG